jgi:predicted CXXCH cytochrome family protein
LRVRFFAIIITMLATAMMSAQTTDVIGPHDLSPGGTSPIKGTLSGSCLYCHAPHSGLNGQAGVAQTPLWNEKLSSVQSYTVYSSSTLVNIPNPSPPLGTDSTLCLSCHDGTVAGSPGALVAYGQVSMSGQMNPSDVFGTNLSTMHPVSFVLPLEAAPDLVQSLTANPPTTADTTGAVRLINGNVECTSCHNPHVQKIDPNNSNFLVINNSGSQLCLACHSTIPTGTGMGLTNVAAANPSAPSAADFSGMIANHTNQLTMMNVGLQFGQSTHASSSGPVTEDWVGEARLKNVGTKSTASSAATRTDKTNPLAGWSTSIHAIATNSVARQVSVENNLGVLQRTVLNAKQSSLGSYGTVAKNGCSSCHTQHNAQGGNSLLRAVDDQSCIICHNGSSNVSPPAPNVLAEMVAPKNGHSFSPGNTSHRSNENALLSQNRHVTCVDCHNPHSSKKVAAFPAAPAIRTSQGRVVGISATDGVTVLNPAINQYENCLRCHGTSTGKQAKVNFGYLPVRLVSGGDPLNIIPQFSSATSSHPVMHDRSSALPQPSLRPNTLNLDGRTQGRSMGSRIFCTDCHNSDDNREFGGNGPNGPHGSMFAHILERRYEFSQAPLPGKLITNLFPNPSLSAEGSASGGPYASCAKCHDLAQIVNNSSFSQHARHVVQDGFSCSVCHTAHGTGVQPGSTFGQGLINFDLNVVAPNGSSLISYNRATNSCSLVCHNHPHQSSAPAGVAKPGRR